MLLTIIIVWAVVLPAVVVGGLLIASSLLGRRARRSGAVEATGMAHELARLAAATQEREGRRDAGPENAPAPERRSVGAAY